MELAFRNVVGLTAENIKNLIGCWVSDVKGKTGSIQVTLADDWASQWPTRASPLHESPDPTVWALWMPTNKGP